MKTQKGSISIIFLLFLILITIAIAQSLRFQITTIEVEKDQLKTLLCAKEYNHSTGQLVRRINYSNKLLKLLKLGEWSTIFIPGINIVTKASAKAAKNILKLEQTRNITMYQKTIFQMWKNNCEISKKVLLTPYQVYGPFKQKRNKFDQILVRKKKWHSQVRGKYIKVSTQIFSESGNSKSQINKTARSFFSIL